MKVIHSVPRQSRWACFGTVFLAVALAGCVDKAQCDQALSVTRDALAKDQPDLARQWRDRAWKICDDPAVTTPLDQEIVAKEAELAKRATDAAQAAQKQTADAAQQRLHTAATLWRAFDKLDAKDRTSANLDAYRDKAGHLSQGLPADYAKQIDDYNAQQYAPRLKLVQAAELTKK